MDVAGGYWTYGSKDVRDVIAVIVLDARELAKGVPLQK